MPDKQEMLAEVRKEASHRNLSARALARLTGMHKQTVSNALKGDKRTRDSTINFLYTKLILERDLNKTIVDKA